MAAELWKRTQKYLEEKSGLRVYPPYTKKGECKESYLVLKEGTAAQYQQFSTQIVYYDVMCYDASYTGVLELAERIQKIMLAYTPHMFPTGIETECYYDDDVRAYMISMQYRAMKRNRQIKTYL